MIPYNEVKSLITAAVVEDDVTVYIKGHECGFGTLLLDDERERIETLDAIYEDMESLINLNLANTMRYGQHVKNCALPNELKVYNWWLQKNFLNKNT